MRRRGRRVARLLAAGALAGLSSWPAWGECRLRAIALPVKMVDSRPIAMVGLNGTEVPLLVDTGAFFSVLTEAVASQLELPLRALPGGMQVTGATGRLTARMTKVKTLRLAGGKVPDVEFIVGLNEVGGGATGVIGGNFLAKGDTEFDLAHGMVRLFINEGDCQDTDLAYWAGDTPVNVIPMASGALRAGQRGNPFRVEVAVNGSRTKALLDTGAPETSLRLSAAKDAGLQPSDLTPGLTVGGGGSGHAKSWMAQVDRLEIGGERINHSQLQVVDTDWIDEGLILGVDYFLAHRIYVARSQGKLYATWNGGPVFVHNQAPAAAVAAHDDAAANEAGAAFIDADALVRRAAASAARKDFAGALSDLDRACAQAPGDTGCLATRADVRLAMKNPAGALADLDEALRLDPALADARTKRAQLRADAKDADGARADLRLLDGALPRQSNLRNAMANVYAKLESPDDALRQWELWLAAHPHDGSRSAVYATRCWMRVQLDLELDRALADCREAMDDNPDNAGILSTLGWVQLRRGDATQALKAFDAAIARSPELAWALYGRGLVRRRLGDPAAAADVAQARALMPDIDERAPVKAAR